jgi:hypothetical protein
MIKVKNKTYSPITLTVNGKSVILPERRSIDVEVLTPQMIALKAQGLLQVIKK